MSIQRIKRNIVRILRRFGLKPIPVVEVVSEERIQKIRDISKRPLANDSEIKRVEICMLKFKEDPSVIDGAVSNLIHRTKWPFKINIYDNRPNTTNMAKVWNRLAREATCDYICIMDTDAYVPDVSPCWLTRMMESIDEKGIVVPLGDNVSGINKAEKMQPYPTATLRGGIWTGFFFLFKKSLWEQEPFDEDFNMYGQDAEWSYRLTKKYGGVILREDVLVHHLHGYSAKKAQKEGSFDRQADLDHAMILLKEKGVEVGS